MARNTNAHITVYQYLLQSSSHCECVGVDLMFGGAMIRMIHDKIINDDDTSMMMVVNDDDGKFIASYGMLVIFKRFSHLFVNSI